MYAGLTSETMGKVYTETHTNIKIRRSTYEELSKLGTLQDSFDTVIRKLLENNKMEVTV
jgi:predicted CopG family antitoxin